MKKFQSYVLNKFNFIKDEFSFTDLVGRFEKLKLNFENSFEVHKIELVDSYTLKVHILRRSTTFIYEYIDKELIKKNTFLFNHSEFEINFEQSYILTYGNFVNNLDVRQFLKRIEIGLNIYQVNVDILLFFQKAQSLFESVKVNSLTIKKFNFSNGMIGRFSGDIVDESIVDSLLTQYNKDLAKIIFLLEKEEILYDVQIFPNGAFKIFSEEIDHLEILTDFIPIIL